jgi:hypothetical protein
MLPCRHGLLASLLAFGCLHCPSESKDLLYEPVPLQAHDVKIAADAEGDAKAPAHVSVFLQRGILSVKGGGAHTLEGVATGATGDAPPRLELMLDRIALTQSTLGGAPPKGDAKFALALGQTPMKLEIDTGVGEAQSIDLGSVPLKEGRFHTTSGHLSIDWRTPNPMPGAQLSLKTDSGYIDVTHLGRACADTLEITNVAGFVGLDVGDIVPECPVLRVTATVTSGKLVLKVPKTLCAVATVDAPADRVVSKGWSSAVSGGFIVEGCPAAARPGVLAKIAAQGGQVELRAD